MRRVRYQVAMTLERSQPYSTSGMVLLEYRVRYETEQSE